MPYVTVGRENGADIDIYYKDWGSGQPTARVLQELIVKSDQISSGSRRRGLTNTQE